jgi:hypothetical protein
MCNCLKDIESKTFEMVKEQKEGEFTKGNITPSSFLIIKNKFSNRATHSEYEFTFAPKKKDGTTGKPKKQTVNITHSYCPFCGEKHK